jgi:hypothetical protein
MEMVHQNCSSDAIMQIKNHAHRKLFHNNPVHQKLRSSSSKTVFIENSSSKTVFIENRSSKNMFNFFVHQRTKFIENCSSMNKKLFIDEQKLFINEHFHRKLFIKEQEKINVHDHILLLRPASAGALCRACRLTINTKSRFILPTCPYTSIIFSPECLCL